MGILVVLMLFIILCVFLEVVGRNYERVKVDNRDLFMEKFIFFIDKFDYYVL